MTDGAVLTTYFVGVFVAAAIIFSQTFGREGTADLIGAVLFGGALWPLTAVGFAIYLLVTRLDHLNVQRRAVLTARDAALAETERWLKETP